MSDPHTSPFEDGSPQEDREAAGEPVSAGPVMQFMFGDRRVRSVLCDGEPWFVAADVCAAIGLGKVNQTVAKLAEDEKHVIQNDMNLGSRQMVIVSESGLYAMTRRSDKPQAKPFQRWITRDVLPSIRRTGSYSRSQRASDRGLGMDFGQSRHELLMETMAVSTSPGPVLGSLPAGDVTVGLAEFLAFVSSGLNIPDRSLFEPDHPNEADVVRFLARRGRGCDFGRNPLNGRWVFRMEALQRWYREVGSVRASSAV